MAGAVVVRGNVDDDAHHLKYQVIMGHRFWGCDYCINEQDPVPTETKYSVVSLVNWSGFLADALGAGHNNGIVASPRGTSTIFRKRVTTSTISRINEGQLGSTSRCVRFVFGSLIKAYSNPWTQFLCRKTVEERGLII